MTYTSELPIQSVRDMGINVEAILAALESAHEIANTRHQLAWQECKFVEADEWLTSEITFNEQHMLFGGRDLMPAHEHHDDKAFGEAFEEARHINTINANQRIQCCETHARGYLDY
jgi:hypothetical protein